MRSTLSFAVATLALAACARNARVESGGDVSISASPATANSLPAGTRLQATLDEQIGTRISKVGDTFTATLQNAVIAQNGDVVVPDGARIRGVVTGLQAASNPTQTAVIKLEVQQLEMHGRRFPLEARIVATNLQTRSGSGDSRDETIRKAGIGAAAGAVLGAVLGGADLEKILIGGALGAAAGTAISLGVGSTEAVIPAGSQMTLQTTQTVALR